MTSTVEPVDDCLFCAIVAGTVPADIVFSDEEFVAFRDISPQAPVHVLVIPRGHYPDAAALAATDSATLGRLVATATTLAGQFGVADNGYRLVTNTGELGGQSVAHLHLHLLGGRQLNWPPG